MVHKVHKPFEMPNFAIVQTLFRSTQSSHWGGFSAKLEDCIWAIPPNIKRYFFSVISHTVNLVQRFKLHFHLIFRWNVINSKTRSNGSHTVRGATYPALRWLKRHGLFLDFWLKKKTKKDKIKNWDFFLVQMVLTGLKELYKS